MGLGGSGGGPSTRAQQTVVAVRDSPDDLNSVLPCFSTANYEVGADSTPSALFFAAQRRIGRLRVHLTPHLRWPGPGAQPRDRRRPAGSLTSLLSLSPRALTSLSLSSHLPMFLAAASASASFAVGFSAPGVRPAPAPPVALPAVLRRQRPTPRRRRRCTRRSRRPTCRCRAARPPSRRSPTCSRRRGPCA